MKKHIRTIIGTALSLALLWWALHDVPLSEVTNHLRHANPWLLALGVIVATLIFPLRARRWRTIFDPIHPKLPLAPLWHSTAIGMGLNNLLPARAGEIARAYTITRTTPVTFPTAVASLAVDRVFDGIIQAILLLAAILSPAFPKTVSVSAAVTGGVIFICAILVALYVLTFFPGPFIRTYELFARRISPTLEAKGREALMTFSEGLRVLRSPTHFIAVFLWALVHWLVNALGWWISMKAVGLNVPFSAAVFLQAFVAFGVAVPSTPGFVGLFEAAAIKGLALYGISKELATTWAVSFHILSFLPITLMGLYYFNRANLTFKELRNAIQSRAPADS